VEKNRDQTFSEIAGEMASYLTEAQESLRIFAGEGCSRVYSNPGVVQAMREAHRRGVKIQIILGPVISALRKGRRRYSALIRLASEGVVELYQRSRRLREGHYHIYDSRIMRVQGFHEPHKNPISTALIKDPAEIRSKVEEFQRSIKSGQGPEGVVVTRVRRPKKEFIFADEKEINRIVELAPSRFNGTEYYDLDVEKLWVLARELHLGDGRSLSTRALTPLQRTLPRLKSALMGKIESIASLVRRVVIVRKTVGEPLKDSLFLILLAAIIAQLVPVLIVRTSTIGKALVIEIAALAILTTILGYVGLRRRRSSNR